MSISEGIPYENTSEDDSDLDNLNYIIILGSYRLPQNTIPIYYNIISDLIYCLYTLPDYYKYIYKRNIFKYKNNKRKI